jgi:hypothetical protein
VNLLICNSKAAALYEQRLADKDQVIAGLQSELATLRAERDRFRDLFVEALGRKWNEPGPIQEIPLQTMTLKPQTQAEFEQWAARLSPAEKAALECWMKDVGISLAEPEHEYFRRYGGASPLEVLT